MAVDPTPPKADPSRRPSPPPELSDAKRLLLDRWLSGGPAVTIPRREDGGPVEATYAQRRMWMHARLHPDSAAYNIGVATRLTGVLDEDALRRSLAALLSRHESLRTTFKEVDGRPYQVVAPGAGLPLTIEEGMAEGPWRSRLDTEPFDLEHGPLVRFGLLRVAPGEHVLMTVVHHAVADGLSLDLLLRELRELYTAFAAGRPSPLRPLAIRYTDYAQWQAGARYDEHLGYWRRAFRDEPPRLELPADRTRPPVPTYRGVSHRFTLEEHVWAALRKLARRHEATSYTTVLSVFAALLHRYTGESRVAVGAVTHGRELPELEGLVGCFADTVVLPLDLDGDLPVGELVDRVRGTCREAFAHQDVPFEVLASELRWDRSAAALPQVLAVMQSPPEAAAMGGLRAEPIEPDVDSARFDLVLNCWETGGRLEGAVTGSADLFDRSTVERIASHLVRMLTAAAEGEDVPVGALPVLPDGEEYLLLHRWGRPVEGDDPLTDRDLATLVADAARRDPDAVAVECGETSLTYRELEARADALGRHLRDLGVGPEVLVGVLMERSAEQVVALLAVLKTGGAFVPLESTWPPTRVREVAGRAGLRVVLSDDAQAGTALAGTGVQVVREPAEAGGDELPGTRGRDMEDLAYVIHTSGSTGAPKGVMIRQQAICNRMLWQIGKLSLGPDDAVLYKAPLGFDISVNEIFLPLVAGARLVVAEPGHDGDIDRLLTTIERHRVTFLYIVASMLDVLLERDDAAGRARSLRHVWCGGEALTGELYERFRAAFGARMYHGYGPAEATIGVSCRVFEPGEPGGRISIGRPNPGARLYILDGAARPVPIGVPGELHVAGLPLARGYLNDPVRTAESFLPDPYSDEPDGRMYRTGDLARFRPDGEIEFLGRTDDQVKIRGFRVEPGEIAATLARHPDVRQAVVLPRPRVGGGQELAAYCAVVVDRTDAAVLEGGGLRTWLEDLLPEYMVPRVFVALPELPLTTAGKVDRRALAALPDPESYGTEGGEAYTAPAEGLEEGIARIWAEVLETERVGAQDHFFDLGGHSLLLVRVQTLMRQRLGREVPLLDLFTHATVARLAAHLRRAADAPAAGPAAERARARALRGRESLARRRGRRGPAMKEDS
ncbi:amino acid adenylation domain-containing protein [Actinomadura sp. DC4]|uniref:non-ribosomal peptide synthetase n=1 Tax=Actinomadura sp. DC4 TaxID=3055069 RepID=UPI0025B03645|nr:amino acid adenylation domain-containing protein [Actinomadura sp. DC4]MDN3356788.1 amino acid adenylation domain-containing protein [Actinomadura sp. DC4]